MSISKVEITTFEPKYAADFARLNLEWIEKYFVVEEQDREVLGKPGLHIMEPGGQIFLALRDGVAVGTVALIPVGEDAFELAKMAVTPSCKGQNIGKRLMLRAIDYALQEGKKKLIIVSNTSLTAALNLYLRFGFKPIPLSENEEYERVNIKLEKVL